MSNKERNNRESIVPCCSSLVCISRMLVAVDRSIRRVRPSIGREQCTPQTTLGFNGSNQPLYDSTKVEIISGTVEGTEKVDPAKGMLSTVQLMVRVKKETVVVNFALSGSSADRA